MSSLLLALNSFSQSPVKTFKEVSLLLKMSPSSVVHILNNNGYKFEKEKTKDGLQFRTYINKEVELFHPWYDNYLDEINIAIKDNEMIAINFLIGETEEETGVADKAYREFERNFRYDGYELFHTDEEDEDADLVKYYKHAKKGMIIMVELYMEEGDVIAADIYMHKKDILEKDRSGSNDLPETVTELAAFLNKNILYSRINFESPSLNFDVVGKTDFDKKSFEFIVENNKLYLKMNIPRNGGCDYGLKKVEAEWTGETGPYGDYWYLGWKFNYSCERDYRNVITTFRVPKENRKLIEDLIRRCCQ